jgi:hypothetical protein
MSMIGLWAAIIGLIGAVVTWLARREEKKPEIQARESTAIVSRAGLVRHFERDRLRCQIWERSRYKWRMRALALGPSLFVFGTIAWVHDKDAWYAIPAFAIGLTFTVVFFLIPKPTPDNSQIIAAIREINRELNNKDMEKYQQVNGE